MQALTLAMIVVVTTFEFLATGDYWGRWAVLPRPAQYAPELLSMAAGAFIILAGVRDGFRFVRAQYWLVFGAIVFTMLCGVVANQVEPGVIFAGVRNYFRAVIWFLIPAVYAFSDREIRTQLRLLAVIAVLQAPLAIQQRLSTKAQQSKTGDFTAGTLEISSILSMFLICGLAIAAAMLLRRLLKPWQFVVLAALLLLPTTLNETKGTLVLLPVALSLAFVAAAGRGRRLKAIAWAVGLMTVFGITFFTVYDYYNLERRYAVPLSEFLTDPERLQRYLWRDEDVGTTEKAAGRVDAIVVPVERLSQDPIGLVFGYGIGSASHSALGQGFTGRHYDVFSPFLITSFPRLFLELGMLGILLVGTLLFMILRDSYRVARQRSDLVGALAAGWVGVAAVIGLSHFYKDIVVVTPLSYLFWYFSGLIAASRMRTLLAPQSRAGLPVAP